MRIAHENFKIIIECYKLEEEIKEIINCSDKYFNTHSTRSLKAEGNSKSENDNLPANPLTMNFLKKPASYGKSNLRHCIDRVQTDLEELKSHVETLNNKCETLTCYEKDHLSIFNRRVNIIECNLATMNVQLKIYEKYYI